jgi:choline dehydrogenase
VRDFNGAGQDGVSGHSVNVVNGIRENAAIVFLTAEARRRPNLAIRGDITIDRVLVGGTAATGVVAADGTAYRAGEVILPAGSYGSPAILPRSGAGPADDLTAQGIGAAGRPAGRPAAAGSPVLSHRPHAGPRAPADDPGGRRDLGAASSEATPGELDLNITATHLIPPLTVPPAQ